MSLTKQCSALIQFYNEEDKIYSSRSIKYQYYVPHNWTQKQPWQEGRGQHRPQKPRTKEVLSNKCPEWVRIAMTLWRLTSFASCFHVGVGHFCLEYFKKSFCLCALSLGCDSWYWRKYDVFYAFVSYASEWRCRYRNKAYVWKGEVERRQMGLGTLILTSCHFWGMHYWWWRLNSFKVVKVTVLHWVCRNALKDKPLLCSAHQWAICALGWEKKWTVFTANVERKILSPCSPP